MTIAFDAKRYFNNATGLGFYSRTLLEGMRRFYPENRYLLYTPYNKGHWAASDDGIRLPDSWLGRAFHPLWRSRGITSQLKRDGVEVFHGLSHELPLGLHRSGIRSVVTVHDLIFLRYPNLYPVVDRFFYEQKYRRAAKEADQVVAISTQTRADLEEYFNIPAEKVHAASKMFLASTHDQRAALGYMHPGRVDVISAGTLVLSRIMVATGATEFIASESDILDGMAWSLAK